MQQWKKEEYNCTVADIITIKIKFASIGSEAVNNLETSIAHGPHLGIWLGGSSEVSLAQWVQMTGGIFLSQKGLPYIVIPSELSLAPDFSFPNEEVFPYMVIPSELSLASEFSFPKKEGLPYIIIPSELSLASEFSFPKKEGLPYIIIPSELSLASEFSFPKKEGLPYEVIPSELSLPFPWQVPAKTIYISNTNPGQDWSHGLSIHTKSQLSSLQ